jgi:hypothetical protein
MMGEYQRFEEGDLEWRDFKALTTEERSEAKKEQQQA